MSNQIEQIRAEIKRLIKHNAEHPKDEITEDVYEYALQDVIEILDKYEQAHPVPTDVQEDKAAKDYYLNLPNSSYGEGGHLLPRSINEAFKAGIAYERERLMKKGDDELEKMIDDFEDWDGSYSRADLPTSYTTRDIARFFANWQRERLMNEAIYAKICIPIPSTAYIKERNIQELRKYIVDNFKDGERVKVIIIKEAGK